MFVSFGDESSAHWASCCEPVNKISKPATQKISQKFEKGKATEGKRKIIYYVVAKKKNWKKGNWKPETESENCSYSKKVIRACIINCIKITQITYYGISFNIQRLVKEIAEMYHV